MTYVVLKRYLYDPIDCVKRAVATQPCRVYRKESSIYILLVFSISIRLGLVSDLGSLSPFFRNELLAPVRHFVSVDPGEGELSGNEDCNMRKARRSTSFQYTTWVLAMQCSWTLMSIRINYPFHGGKSLPARQEDSKL